jgi:hypothetical protein
MKLFRDRLRIASRPTGAETLLYTYTNTNRYALTVYISKLAYVKFNNFNLGVWRSVFKQPPIKLIIKQYN